VDIRPKAQGAVEWTSTSPFSRASSSHSSPFHAPDISLQFLFYGGIVVLPVIAVYTIGIYWVFRGKVDKGYS
jgi:hypothetical protein